MAGILPSEYNIDASQCVGSDIIADARSGTWTTTHLANLILRIQEQFENAVTGHFNITDWADTNHPHGWIYGNKWNESIKKAYAEGRAEMIPSSTVVEQRSGESDVEDVTFSASTTGGSAAGGYPSATWV